MPNKLTDAEIKKALECCSTYHDVSSCKNCPLDGKCEPNVLEQYALDLINRYEAENESLKAEVERLKNAYKQCAWERDIFAEDMKEEIKKDCSYLMLDIKTIKAEAYKEFGNKLERAFSKSESQMPNSEVVKQTVQICRNAIRIVINELVGDKSAGKIND